MMNLRAKLLFGFGGLLALLVMVSMLSIVVITWYSGAIDEVLYQNYRSVVYGQKMLDALDQLHADAQDIAADERMRSANMDFQVAAARKQFADNLDLERQNLTVPGEGAAEASLREAWDKYREKLDQLGLSTPTAQPTALSMGGREGLGREVMLRDQVKIGAQKIIDMNLDNMVSVNGQAKKWARMSREALFALLAAGLLLGSLVIAFVGRWILRPLRTLTRSVREIEAGNLNLMVPVRSRDEVGQLAEAFNLMTAKLRAFRETDQAKLLRTQQTTQLAIDSLPDAVAVINPDGAIELTNGAALRLFNLRPGTVVQDLKLDWLLEVFQLVRDQGKLYEPQGYRNALQVFDNGTERFFLPQGVPIIDSAGKLAGVTLVLMDVTRLRQLDEMKSSLVSTVSHELRTPLTSIRLANHLLLSNRIGSLSSKQTDVVMESRDNADRLQKIIENLLDMSRIEAGRSTLELASIKPHELATGAVDQIRSAAQEKGIELRIDVPVELPKVRADKARIHHVLLNLLTNALRYTPHGGRISISARAEGETVAFCVQDNGQGIPKDYQPRVFERFFRVPGQNGTGVGLGLAITKEIVNAHDGEISVESKEGIGTTFRFTLQQERLVKEVKS
jgi:two-component system, NtrC family, sensor histidine kinase KinB